MRAARLVVAPAVALVALLAALWPAVVAAREIVDLAGRSVTVPDRVERIIIGEGRYIPALALLDRDNPIGRVVGMMGDYEQVDPATYARFHVRFPDIAAIPRFGRASQDSFSLERALALRPQVAIFGVDGHGPGAGNARVIEVLEQAGIAIVFIDFRNAPLVNTPRSIEVLGAVLGREADAAAFVAEWRAAYDVVRERLAQKRPPAPRVFVESRVGLMPCCETMVRGMMGDFVTAAGGTNLAEGVILADAGTVSLEYLLVNQPDIYVGTAIGGASSPPDSAWIALGPDVSAERAVESLARATQRVGIAELSAVKAGRAFAVWHHFYNSPFNVAALQAFAKWLHPELFTDLDPEGLLRRLHERYQPFPLEGTYWTSLNPPR
ncbi:iron complex transport system substrate-binding protein [Ancylobacter aquaticus]|uniref:Iron complex transport system substrate-binding protein n=1 Tax=Ancylobacter aquaticus TaxID=100 RepID=A0A4R1I9J6_ANCAQ|nr:ABC transporter substrate-binding protein [Ancylobacter aquaticus]TCK30883.1 iron complex transport system substrate-binding protein [Ancylobacter aquaticus]